MELSALSLLPSLVAIALALYSKNVLLSLFGGILLGLFILNNFAFVHSLEALYQIFLMQLSQLWILKTLGFAILVGSVMELIQKSGGIGGFISFIHKKSLIQSGRGALLLSYFIGVLIFIESSITALIAGAVGKPLCDKYHVEHAKLAFVCDSTSAPISSLLVLNGWGALLLGLIATQITQGMISGDSVDILIHSVMYNFYAMSALLVTFIAIWFNIDLGYMKNASPNTQKQEENTLHDNTNMFYMILPIFLMIIAVFFFLYLTGEGNILKGSGSSSIFYTMIATLVFMLFYYVGTKNMSLTTFTKTSFNGAKKLFPIAMILLFAFTIGKVTTELKTGLYLASLASQNLDVIYLASIIFLLSSIISFATGTSWGTFSIMIPVAVPMAVSMDANISLAIGAVISGGIFGDHCSPISDTTIISAMASECEVVEHVKTQLPYALVSALIALVLFLLFSIF